MDKAFATVNDVLTYTVTIQNTGNVLATNVIFQDPIPIGTTFIANSVTVDGVSQPGANPQLALQLLTYLQVGLGQLHFKYE